MRMSDWSSDVCSSDLRRPASESRPPPPRGTAATSAAVELPSEVLDHDPRVGAAELHASMALVVQIERDELPRLRRQRIECGEGVGRDFDVAVEIARRRGQARSEERGVGKEWVGTCE